MSTTEPVLIAGRWRDADATSTFQATDPNRSEPIENRFPVSSWADCDEALSAAVVAFEEMRTLPRETIAAFLERYADRLDAAKERLVERAYAETGLAKSPRLSDVELPRTSGQLRKAAAAARSGDWAMPTIDTRGGLRSCFRSLGPVCVLGPNNFPFAFNSVSGGDFAAAIAAGNPVIAKANSSHPGTSQLLAEEAAEAARETGMPEAAVQLIYRTSHEDGERLVADPRIGATGYTGSRTAGLKLKAAADRAGKPIYLELSSVNPVVVTPGALRERGEKIADEYVTSALMGSGQFCTNPGILVLPASDDAERFIATLAERYGATAPGTLLSPGVAKSLSEAIEVLQAAGAEVLTGGGPAETGRCAVPNTLLRTTAKKFLGDPERFQTEAFGNASLIVVATDTVQMVEVIKALEGNLTGCIYAAAEGEEQDYAKLAYALEPKVGRLLNDKMPTGVAVSPAMNHGGPYPSTGHPGFTAVGIPASLVRFGKLTCFDQVPNQRLPELLRDANPTGSTWRYIDGEWTQKSL
ncbi:aldehyde dehydrogenase (NADP(+)) [Candidatus Laterigemmans baculatus]|uniref:aldehyde dehydrogenase (NADP(+)) n=1 Tax=Candidatus Laterigemmans baculatus TaxID=2770505 RepID=UPI0013DAB6B4|nr:aldehyde dehydrogenase (NADP(+)) [Candidatus Laterigemmans baculatus]